jgi:hypothetical protein
MKIELEKIITVSGKPGWFHVIGGSRNVVIAESLIDGKRMPISANQKVSSLSDISMFTLEEDVPLRTILLKAKEVFVDGGTPGTKATGAELRAAMKSVLPTYDEERVYESDLKKFFSWFNLLQSKDMLDFAEVAETESE